MTVFVTTLVQGALSLDTGRFLTGYGIAAFSYVVYIYDISQAISFLVAEQGCLIYLMMIYPSFNQN